MKTITTERKIKINLELRGTLAAALQAAADRRNVDPAILFADFVEHFFKEDNLESYFEVETDFAFQFNEELPASFYVADREPA